MIAIGKEAIDVQESPRVPPRVELEATLSSNKLISNFRDQLSAISGGIQLNKWILPKIADLLSLELEISNKPEHQIVMVGSNKLKTILRRRLLFLLLHHLLL